MSQSPITALYVPGNRPALFEKAIKSGAESIIIDLEDAVPQTAKAEARLIVAEWMTTRATTAGDPSIQLRINGPASDGNTADRTADLAALARIDKGAPSREFQIRLPKVEGPQDVDALGDIIETHPVAALIETASGVENADAIARHPNVVQIGLGEADLASDLGTQAPEAMDYARIRILYASRAAHLPAPMLSAYTKIADLAGLKEDTERGKRLGWWGRTAVHPSQLPVIRQAFAPTPTELSWATAVVSATKTGGVSTLPSGEMIDRAMLGLAQKILQRSAGKG